jgi:hypothetical protein
MANRAYGNYRDLMLLGGVPNWATDSIKAVLLSSAYTPDYTNHKYLSDVSAYIVGAAVGLTGIAESNGQVAANATTFSAVASGSTVKYVAIYKDTGTPGTSPLMILLDTASGSPGLPVTTNGGDIVITWGTPLFQP